MIPFKSSDPISEQAVFLALRQAGIVARSLSGRVANDEKHDPTSLPNDDDALRARRSAKTVVDEIVQEIILLAVQHDAGTKFRVDAEEETPTRARFTGEQSDSVLVLDPVDGTVEYINGRDSYSICVGFSAGGNYSRVYVYFPARDVLYFIGQDGRARVWPGFSVVGSAPTLVPPAVPRTNIVYVNGRVPSSVLERLTAIGYAPHDDTEDRMGAPDCLLACLSGEALCYLSHTRNMRDIMLGAVVAASPNGYATDWSGRKLRWPGGGRVPHAVFGLGVLPDDIALALAEYSTSPEAHS